MPTTPSEKSPLFRDNDDNNNMNVSEDQKFRLVKGRSLLRSCIFLAETIALQAGYTYLLLLLRRKHQNVIDENGNVSNVRIYLQVVYGIIYMIRINAMASWLLPRLISIAELTFVMLVFVPAILVSFALLTALQSEMSRAAIFLSLGLYSLGSFLNTGSELQRKLWKRRPENRGRCYTRGLFGLSRNINYLGDALLFCGWAVATGSRWNAWVPALMGLSFYGYHIPSKERYLAERYREDWPAYAASTKSFVPYLF